MTKKIVRFSMLLAVLMFFLFSYSCDNDTVQVTEPVVYTIVVQSVGQNYALCEGLLVDDGGNPLTSRGIIWSQKAQMTIVDDQVYSAVSDGFSKGYTLMMDRLAAGTTYYVKAFATNSAGTSYGEEIEFKTIDEDGTFGEVTDIDGNVYKTLIIAGREWTTQNLRVGKYNDGTAISTNLTDDEWAITKVGAYGVYPNEKTDGLNSDEDVLNNYGGLYNWYAVTDKKGLCPKGWHVPTDLEWQQLEIHLGMNSSEANDMGARGEGIGTMLKDERTAPRFTHPRWNAQGSGASNSVSFSALAGGNRQLRGVFSYVGYYGVYWTSTEVSTGDAWFRQLMYYQTSVIRDHEKKQLGYSVRCVKTIK